MGDLAGFGKIAEVILNKIADVTGTLYEPTQIRRVGSAKADAEAELIIKRTEAEILAGRMRDEDRTVILGDISDIDTLRERAARRLVTREVNRQSNLETIVHESLRIDASEVADEQTERPLETDWIETFLRYAQDVSSDGVRQIWSQILASQANGNRPAVSKATLDALRLLEPAQARVFERAVQLFISIGQIMDIEPHGDPNLSFNLNTIEALALEDIGFMKRMAGKEPSLELHGVTLTFWDDHAKLEYADANDNAEQFWNTDDHRGEVLQHISDLTAGTARDTHALRKDVRLDRLLLTSRGYELASVLFDGFYDLLTQEDLSGHERLGEFAKDETQKFVLDKWAQQISALGCVVVLNERVSTTETSEAGETVSRTALRPTRVYCVETQSWIAF